MTGRKKNKELTIQETKVMKLLLLGKSDKEICDFLFITKSTLKTYICKIYWKYSLFLEDYHEKNIMRVTAMLHFLQDKKSISVIKIFLKKCEITQLELFKMLIEYELNKRYNKIGVLKNWYKKSP